MGQGEEEERRRRPLPSFSHAARRPDHRHRCAHDPMHPPTPPIHPTPPTPAATTPTLAHLPTHPPTHPFVLRTEQS